MTQTTSDQFTGHFIQVDEEGYLKAGEVRITDPAYGKALFENLKLDETGALVTSYQGKPLIVEAFDEPLVASSVERQSHSSWKLFFQYNFEQELKFELTSENTPLTTLSLDEWDRFHGSTTTGLPFVFSRSAQADFFNQLDNFDDTGIFIGDLRYEVPDWLTENPEVNNETFWTHIYQTETPRWELEEPTPVLKDILPQLKIPRAKILVPGCGSGNDAAFLAQSGHIVTAIDISPEAIERASAKYGKVKDLQFVQANIFDLPEQFIGQFDLVFEHTCFCAITPSRRNELIKSWTRTLRPGGQILGIFFVHPKRVGPPYGGSEWELRERFKKLKLRSLYWTRWQHSIPRRMGKELVVFSELIR